MKAGKPVAVLDRNTGIVYVGPDKEIDLLDHRERLSLTFAMVNRQGQGLFAVSINKVGAVFDRCPGTVLCASQELNVVPLEYDNGLLTGPECVVKLLDDCAPNVVVPPGVKTRKQQQAEDNAKTRKAMPHKRYRARSSDLNDDSSGSSFKQRRVAGPGLAVPADHNLSVNDSDTSASSDSDSSDSDSSDNDSDTSASSASSASSCCCRCHCHCHCCHCCHCCCCDSSDNDSDSSDNDSDSSDNDSDSSASSDSSDSE